MYFLLNKIFDKQYKCRRYHILYHIIDDNTHIWNEMDFLCIVSIRLQWLHHRLLLVHGVGEDCRLWFTACEHKSHSNFQSETSAWTLAKSGVGHGRSLLIRRGLLPRSLDGSNGVGTVARYINANIRTNTSLVSERVRIGSERSSPMFTEWCMACLGESLMLWVQGGWK